MSDNNTNPEMKNLKLNDDVLEKVAGGSQSIYIVKGTTTVPVYCQPKIYPTPFMEPVGELFPGNTLHNVIADCGYPGWLMVPIRANASKIAFFLNENYTDVYIEGKYLDLKK